MTFSPVFLSIIDDLRARDTQWYAHNILTNTVPIILSIAPYLTRGELTAIRGEADHDSDVRVLVDLALTAHLKHRA